MNKIKGQVDKFNVRKEDKVLFETGLEKDLWYRKVKEEGDKDKEISKQSKLDNAIKR